MPFLEHLEELRRALIGAVIAVCVCAGVAYMFSGTIIDYVVVSHVGTAQFTQPMEAFMTRVKVSLLLGLVVALPVVAFQIWSFVVPGLMGHERKLVLPLVAFSTVLFLTGIGFSYFVLTPMMVKMLLGFGTEHLRADITVNALLDFIIKMGLGAGILFQLPLVVALLTLIDVVSPQTLLSKWRHAIVGILILSAVVTPGDGPSAFVLAIPVAILYFLSILLSLAIVRRGRKRDALNAAADVARDERDRAHRGPAGRSERSGEAGLTHDARAGDAHSGAIGSSEDADAARPHRAEVSGGTPRVRPARRARSEVRRQPAREVPPVLPAPVPSSDDPGGPDASRIDSDSPGELGVDPGVPSAPDPSSTPRADWGSPGELRVDPGAPRTIGTPQLDSDAVVDPLASDPDVPTPKPMDGSPDDAPEGKARE